MIPPRVNVGDKITARWANAVRDHALRDFGAGSAYADAITSLVRRTPSVAKGLEIAMFRVHSTNSYQGNSEVLHSVVIGRKQKFENGDPVDDNTTDVPILRPPRLAYQSTSRLGITYSNWLSAITSSISYQKRTATKTGLDPQVEVVTPSYHYNDRIWCLFIGKSIELGTPQTILIYPEWLDLNVDGRVFAKES